MKIGNIKIEKIHESRANKCTLGGGNIVNVKQLLNDETRDYILIIKEAGKFYRAYDIDALIINMLIGYQVTMGPKIGFPDNAFV